MEASIDLLIWLIINDKCSCQVSSGADETAIFRFCQFYMCCHIPYTAFTSWYSQRYYLNECLACTLSEVPIRHPVRGTKKPKFRDTPYIFSCIANLHGASIFLVLVAFSDFKLDKSFYVFIDTKIWLTLVFFKDIVLRLSDIPDCKTWHYHPELSYLLAVWSRPHPEWINIYPRWKQVIQCKLHGPLIFSSLHDTERHALVTQQLLKCV